MGIMREHGGAWHRAEYTAFQNASGLAQVLHAAQCKEHAAMHTQ